MVLWRPIRPSRTNTKKKMSFSSQGPGMQKQQVKRYWSNRQVWPWRTKWSRAKANRVLWRGHLVTANTLFQQHNRGLYTGTSPDGQHWNQTDYILCSWGWRSSIQAAKTRLGTDCGSVHELLIAKFRLKLKKTGETTRPFRMTQIKSLMII